MFRGFTISALSLVNFGLIAFAALSASAATPVISQVRVSSVSSNSAVVQWTTDISADSRVNYGLATSYGTTKVDRNLVISHSITLSNLKSGTLHNYRVRSRDANGVMATSGNYTFRTLAVSAPTPTPTPDPTPVPPPFGSISIPPGTSWYWQLQGNLNTARTAKLYDIDLYDTSEQTIASLRQSGHIVICYFSAGSYENWRSDASQFPSSALGEDMDGWAGEKWLDVRNANVRSIMAKRIELARAKGCQGVEPDNVDGYSNRTGFPLTAQDQISFNSYLADQAHARGLVIALKNSTDLVKSLVSKFDFAVVEECFRYSECSAYSPFISQNKAVLNAEYRSYSSAVCSQAKSMAFSTVFYNLDLDGRVYNPCP